MKLMLTALALTLSLSACSGGPSKLDKAALHSIAPEIPPASQELQSDAANELKNRQCHALGELLAGCLITRDQARLLY